MARTERPRSTECSGPAGVTKRVERKERFGKRYENGTKLGRESPEKQEDSNSKQELALDLSSSSKAKPSSIQEIAAYCEERNKGVNAEAFWDFYESKGWKVGNQAMKDWKAAVRTWEKRLGAEEKHGSRRDQEFAEARKRSRETD